jgi:hypothetical protein
MLSQSAFDVSEKSKKVADLAASMTVFDFVTIGS